MPNKFNGRPGDAADCHYEVDVDEFEFCSQTTGDRLGAYQIPIDIKHLTAL